MNNLFQPDGNGGAANAGIERHLRDLYRGEDPPAALTGRILAQARRQRPAPPRGAWLRRRGPLVSLCAALLAACVYAALGIVHRQQLQAQRAQEAQARLVYALQITAGELNWAEVTIHRDMAAGGTGGVRQ